MPAEMRGAEGGNDRQKKERNLLEKAKDKWMYLDSEVGKRAKEQDREK